MKDRAGNELQVGDRVLTLEPGRSSSWLSWATVVGFTDKMVRVKFDKAILGTTVRNQASVVKPFKE